MAAGLAIVGACAVFFGSRRGESAPPSPAAVAASNASARPAVVVELFSSEGCSSCPPADAYVSTLARTQPVDGVTVIALEENVDYWDRLGWRDPFGSPAFSERQQEYARVLPDHHVCSPPRSSSMGTSWCLEGTRKSGAQR